MPGTGFSFSEGGCFPLIKHPLCFGGLEFHKFLKTLPWMSSSCHYYFDVKKLAFVIGNKNTSVYKITLIFKWFSFILMLASRHIFSPHFPLFILYLQMCLCGITSHFHHRNFRADFDFHMHKCTAIIKASCQCFHTFNFLMNSQINM